MNKTLVMANISLVAVVMGFSSIAPSMAFQPIEIDSEVQKQTNMQIRLVKNLSDSL